jgi:hypothetical protein
MADKKISALTSATTPLAGTEVLPIVQSSSTVKVSVANLTAGRTQTSNGIVQGTAATGYNFTANTPAAGMTSQLLNGYEEGTWTPVPTPGSGVFVLVGTVAGIYTRIGRTVTATARVTITNIGTGTGQIDIAGLPFTAGSPTNIPYFTGCGMQTASFKSLSVWLAAGSSTLSTWYYDQTTPLANGQGVYITIQYTV